MNLLVLNEFLTEPNNLTTMPPVVVNSAFFLPPLAVEVEDVELNIFLATKYFLVSDVTIGTRARCR